LMKAFRRVGIIAALIAVMIFSLSITGLAEDRFGPWVDEVIVVEEPDASAALSRLEAGDIDVYAYTVSMPDLFQKVQENPNLNYQVSFGSYNELTFNPVGPEFPATGKLNPFAVPRIREAMNILIDREYISNEIYGGMAVAKFFPITASFPDYARYADTVRVLELRYAHDPVKADAIIAEEMVKLGAERVGGKWYYKGEPVEIIILIRVEDERREIGDYIGNLLADIGFEVVLDYRTSAEATPIWYLGDPGEGKFHIYTGGWITTVVDRDQSDNFAYFYTDMGLPNPIWQAYENAPEFYEVADKLAYQKFTTIEERNELFRKALELCMQDSTRVWLVDQISFSPHLAEVSVTADLAGAIAGSYLWPHTIRRGDEVGGQIRIAMPSILTDAWNPLGGSNWIYDMALVRPTSDLGLIYDPYTGLLYPQRIERAELYALKDLPIGKTLDWLDVIPVDEITVPEDAWVDWDPVEQRFITAGEKFPEGLKANIRSVAYYPENFFAVSKWHDGSPMSPADMILGLILTFDRAYEDSPVYDESEKASFNAWLPTHKGYRIISFDPFIFEWYSDRFYLDAEWTISTAFPNYSFGPGAWHTLGVGLLAEADGQAAFSSDKADKAKVQHLNYIAGASLDILNEYLDKAIEDNFIPYANVLGEHITAEQAAERWANLKSWYEDKGHFWVGMGAFYLEKPYPIEKVVHLKRFEDYPYPAGRWDVFAEPMIAEVEIIGSRRVQIGAKAEFDIFVNFDDEPYPTELLDNIKYMVFDASGELVYVGQAVPVLEGLWRADLSPEVTSKLSVGVSKLEIALVSKVVSIPTFETLEFVTTR